MNEIEKAIELIVDDYNFQNMEGTMVADHLELMSFFRIGKFWVALFDVTYDRATSFEITYDENAQKAVIVTYSERGSVTIEE